MITRRRHDEVEVAIDLPTIALGDHCLERGGGLLKGGTPLGGVAAEFAETKTQAKQGVSIGVQIIAELRRERWRVWWQDAIAPNDRSGLSASDQASAKPRSCSFIDVRDYRLRRCWHWRLPGHRQRR